MNYFGAYCYMRQETIPVLGTLDSLAVDLAFIKNKLLGVSSIEKNGLSLEYVEFLQNMVTDMRSRLENTLKNALALERTAA